MKIRLGDLRKMIREHFRHGSSPHARTPDSNLVLKAMQDSPKVQKEFEKIDKSRELAGFLEELIDATGMSRQEIRRALATLFRHEKPPRSS